MDFAPYLDILADELDLLYWDGVEVVHATTNETFICRAMLLSIVTDYRGMPEIFRVAQSPAFVGACYVCGVEGWRVASKTCYSGQHRHACSSCSVSTFQHLCCLVGYRECRPRQAFYRAQCQLLTCRVLEMAPGEQCRVAGQMLLHQWQAALQHKGSCIQDVKRAQELCSKSGRRPC